MSNSYFNHSSPVTRFTLARAEAVNSIFQAVVSGFDKLPTPTELKEARVTWAGTDTGSADVYAVSLTYPPSGYAAGFMVRFIPSNTNTGPSTINVNGLGAKAIKRSNGDPLIAEDLSAGTIATVEYDGTDFRLTSTNQADVFLASQWATKTGAAVNNGEYSAKEYAQGALTATGGSAKAWAVDASSPDGTGYSAKTWATKTAASVDGNGYSAKEHATGDLEASGGSAKAWAVDASSPDGTSSKSAKTHAAAAGSSESNAAGSATNAANSASAAANSASDASDSANLAAAAVQTNTAVSYFFGQL